MYVARHDYSSQKTIICGLKIIKLMCFFFQISIWMANLTTLALWLNELKFIQSKILRTDFLAITALKNFWKFFRVSVFWWLNLIFLVDCLWWKTWGKMSFHYILRRRTYCSQLAWKRSVANFSVFLTEKYEPKESRVKFSRITNTYEVILNYNFSFHALYSKDK